MVEEDAEEEAQAKKCFDLKNIIMDQINLKESDEIVNELLDYLQEDGSQLFKNMLSEEELDVIERVYFYEQGLHLQNLELTGETQEARQEERLAAYHQWVEEIRYVKRKGKAFEYSPTQKRDLELRRTNPYYRQITDQLRDSQPPFSYVDDCFIPNEKAENDELARVESLIGRYPVGFRHYENYYNYLHKYSDASVEDY